MGQAALLKGYVKNPSKYSFEEAMAKRSKSARMIRLGAIGDPARVNHSELKKFIAKARKEKLAVIGYTHHHREKVNEGLKKVLMASCDNMEQADEAVSRGWRATAVVPFDFVGKRFVTKAGNVGVVCPAQTAPESVTCNSCHLCDAARPTNFDIIAFRDHGPRARAAKRRKLPVL
jgi:hypothetical protein